MLTRTFNGKYEAWLAWVRDYLDSRVNKEIQTDGKRGRVGALAPRGSGRPRGCSPVRLLLPPWHRDSWQIAEKAPLYISFSSFPSFPQRLPRTDAACVRIQQAAFVEYFGKLGFRQGNSSRQLFKPTDWGLSLDQSRWSYSTGRSLRVIYDRMRRWQKSIKTTYSSQVRQGWYVVILIRSKNKQRRAPTDLYLGICILRRPTP